MERSLAHNLGNGERTEDVRLKEVAPFNQWLLKSPVKKGLEKAGFRIPTVIQASAIPVGKTGIDLIVRAKAGTGKTLIYCTILLENCCRSTGLHSLIITPTREIAIQTEMVLKRIAQFCKYFKVVNTIGGNDVAMDRKNLQNASTVVGTPGRLIHLIQSEILNTSNIKLVVLDEADQLYSSSHCKNLEIILKAIPSQRQIIACSATFRNNLDEDLAKVMRNPLLISTKDQVTVLLGIKQYTFELPESKTSVLEMEAKVKALIDIFGRVPFKLCMLFAGSKSRAESYSHYLADSGWKCDLTSGGQSQAKRSEIFRKFQNFETRILISTDLMARGIDSEHVNLVINIEPPRDMVTYLHRIGRAGRFGSHGIAITLISSKCDNECFTNILAEIGCGMNVNVFPKTATDGKDENFWDPTTFQTKIQRENEKEIKIEADAENCSAILRSKENLPEDPHTLSKPIQFDNNVDSRVSLDTKTFCIDSKDSAVNILPALVAENKENLLRAEDTPTSNRSSVQLSANTIDDASSIAADSVFSSQLELNAPHPSLALDHTKNLDYCSYVSSELREAIRDEVLKTDLFMDYCANVLKDPEGNNENETELDTKHESFEDLSKVEENEKEEDKRPHALYDDMFADYTNFITDVGDQQEEELKLKEEGEIIAEETSEENDVSLQVRRGSLDITAKESENNDLLEQTNVEALSYDGATESQSSLQETICASNGSYSADSEPSIESKVMSAVSEPSIESKVMSADFEPSIESKVISADSGPSMESKVMSVDFEPSMESKVMSAVSEPSIESKVMSVDFEPSMESKVMSADFEPSMESKVMSADSEPSMESKAISADSGPSMESKVMSVDFEPSMESKVMSADFEPSMESKVMSADSEPSMELKVIDEQKKPNQPCEVDLNSEPDTLKNDKEAEETDQICEDKEPNPPRNDEEIEESDEDTYDDEDEDLSTNAKIDAEKKSKFDDLWKKEYWRQVNFMQFYVNFALDYRKQCENN